MKRKIGLGWTVGLALILCACGQISENEEREESVSLSVESGALESETLESETLESASSETAAAGAEASAAQEEEWWRTCFDGMSYSKSYKGIADTNPIMTQRFGADPYAMVYGDRVYFYMTADAPEYDAAGEIQENTYGKIQSLNVVSTDDMVNFTDHGSIQAAGRSGAAKWADNSWAPAAAWKNIDGKDTFFLYFADNGGGIGVLTSDSPTGPFTDPLGEALVSRGTPNCADVLWLFDPAVLVDDDGRAYLYFGGGVPEGKTADPGTARVVELGEDMISLKGDPVRIDVPYLFEDSGIHKAGNQYYYTYCSNWQVDEAGTAKYGFHSAEIVSLVSDSPMGPFTFKERILENPGKYCGLYGNNHHCVFSFQDRWYITYHTRALEKAMGIEHGYRCTQIDEFTMAEDGTIGVIRQTTSGRQQLKNVDAFAKNSAVSMALQAGLDTEALDNAGNMVLTAIDSGDYFKVQGVDFDGQTAAALELVLRKTGEAKEPCAVCVRADTLFGEAFVFVPLEWTAEDGEEFVTCQAQLYQEISGVHDLYFVFSGSGYQLKEWHFC